MNISNNKQLDGYVAAEFNRQAKRYDDSRLVKSYQRRTQVLALEHLSITKGMNILDLGCGTGWATFEIAARLQGTGRVIGFDLSEKMIEQAQQKLAETKYNNIEFVLNSAHFLDYEKQFDYVISTNAFHHFANKPEIFSRVWKSLNHDGKFIIQDICDDYFLMKLVDLAGKVGEKAHVGSATSQGLKNLFISTGFSDVEVKKVKLNWFWGIMVGCGVKLVN